MGFSENYECVDQNAIRSQHWTKKQIMFSQLQPGLKSQHKNLSKLYIVHLFQIIRVIRLCMEKVLIDVDEKTTFDQLTFLTDGAACQFKLKLHNMFYSYLLH